MTFYVGQCVRIVSAHRDYSRFIGMETVIVEKLTMESGKIGYRLAGCSPLAFAWHIEPIAPPPLIVREMEEFA